MGVTFLIGNGFDLNLGMKTRYTDMYDSYIKSKSKSTVIDKFKKDLQKEEHNHYQNWSDFEMGMARYAQNFNDENEFIECIRDFKAHMVNWLRWQQKSIMEDFWKHVNIDAFIDSLVGFYNGLIPNDRYEIENVLLEEGLCVCSFISFNYTNILDELLQEVSGFYEGSDKNINFNVKKDVVHIHGNLDNDVVLGIDNTRQIKAYFWLSEKTKQAFIKPEFNNRFDYRRVRTAIDLINNSSLVCAYGLSLGESDKMWIEALSEWLLTNERHHLVYYFFDPNPIPAYNFDLRMEKESELKEELMKKMNLSKEQIQTVWKRIHIPISCNLFDFFEQEEKKLATV